MTAVLTFTRVVGSEIPALFTFRTRRLRLVFVPIARRAVRRTYCQQQSVANT